MYSQELSECREQSRMRSRPLNSIRQEKTMLRFLIISLLALALSACGTRGPIQVGDVLSTPLASSGGNWNLKFGLSGGFIGLNRTMEVRSNGQAIVTDGRS